MMYNNLLFCFTDDKEGEGFWDGAISGCGIL
jgi:hypothetical protein